MSSEDKDPQQKKKGRMRTLMHSLERRMLLDASTLTTAVNAISGAIANWDAQDIDGDGNFTAGDQPTSGTAVGTWTDSWSTAGQGGANNATQGTGSRQATYQANAFGTGIGGLVFDGTDTYTVANNTLINTVTGGGTYSEKTFAAVFKTGASVSGFQVIYEQGGSIRGF